MFVSDIDVYKVDLDQFSIDCDGFVGRILCLYCEYARIRNYIIMIYIFSLSLSLLYTVF